MSSAIEKYKEQIDALQRSKANLRQRVEIEAREVQGAAIMAATGYAWGAWEKDTSRQSRTIPTIAGMDPALAWGAGLTVFGRFVDGRAGEIMSDAGKAVLTVAAYKQGQR